MSELYKNFIKKEIMNKKNNILPAILMLLLPTTNYCSSWYNKLYLPFIQTQTTSSTDESVQSGKIFEDEVDQEYNTAMEQLMAETELKALNLELQREEELEKLADYKGDHEGYVLVPYPHSYRIDDDTKEEFVADELSDTQERNAAIDAAYKQEQQKINNTLIARKKQLQSNNQLKARMRELQHEKNIRYLREHSADE